MNSQEFHSVSASEEVADTLAWAAANKFEAAARGDDVFESFKNGLRLTIQAARHPSGASIPGSSVGRLLDAIRLAGPVLADRAQDKVTADCVKCGVIAAFDVASWCGRSAQDVARSVSPELMEDTVDHVALLVVALEAQRLIRRIEERGGHLHRAIAALDAPPFTNPSCHFH